MTPDAFEPFVIGVTVGVVLGGLIVSGLIGYAVARMKAERDGLGDELLKLYSSPDYYAQQFNAFAAAYPMPDVGYYGPRRDRETGRVGSIGRIEVVNGRDAEALRRAGRHNCPRRVEDMP